MEERSLAIYSRPPNLPCSGPATNTPLWGLPHIDCLLNIICIILYIYYTGSTRSGVGVTPSFHSHGSVKVSAWLKREMSLRPPLPTQEWQSRWEIWGPRQETAPPAEQDTKKSQEARFRVVQEPKNPGKEEGNYLSCRFILTVVKKEEKMMTQKDTYTWCPCFWKVRPLLNQPKLNSALLTCCRLLSSALHSRNVYRDSRQPSRRACDARPAMWTTSKWRQSWIVPFMVQVLRRWGSSTMGGMGYCLWKGKTSRRESIWAVEAVQAKDLSTSKRADCRDLGLLPRCREPCFGVKKSPPSIVAICGGACSLEKANLGVRIPPGSNDGGSAELFGQMFQDHRVKYYIQDLEIEDKWAHH